MIYRTAAALIVVFWLVMTTLLIRNEVHPEDSRVREVPLSHVLKLLYLHEQPSDLKIYAGGTPMGHLRFHPRTQKETGDRIVEFTGTILLQLQLPDRPSRISWEGTMRMDPEYKMKRSEWAVTLHDPEFTRLEVRAQAGVPKARVCVRTKDQVIKELDVEMTESGLTSLARQFGANADFFTLVQQARVQAQTQAQPTVRARYSTMRYRGENTETFLVSVEQKGQTLVQCQFSQLGQILQARTILGYTLQPDDLFP